MADVDLRRLTLRYGVGWGGLTGVALVAVAAVASVPLKLAGGVLVGVGLFVGPVVVGVTDSGIETAAASTRIGFGAGDPNQYQAGGLPVPHPVEIALWSTGVGLVGVVTVAAVA